MRADSKIYLAGHDGLVGSAIHRALQAAGYRNVVTRGIKDLDLRRQADVEAFFRAERPEYVILAAAKVGGIVANSSFPAEFIYDNLMIAANVIHCAHEHGVKKLLNLGSSCIYPKLAPQPLKEEYLLTGPLEPTNEAYAVAKIAALRLCKHYHEQYGEEFISAMPTNMYGPGDNFHPTRSHVLPAMIRKFHEAKVAGTGVTLWGDGTPYREFLYSDDLARAIVFLMEKATYADTGDFINVGSQSELTIAELARKVAKVVGYSGEISWDTSKPNGTPRKLMDSSRLAALGWKPLIGLEEGIALAYADFLKRFGSGEGGRG
jgi:GDP-L-fucose synthase